MRIPNSRSKALLGGVATLIVAAVLLTQFLPTTLGGSFAYAIVSGDSMEPTLTTDDLVLLRGASEYRIGDTVAFRHPQIGTVLHRIVVVDGERFTTRGDNRTGNDTYRPTPDDVIGRQWAVIPRAGAAIREIQSPAHAALLVLGTLAVVAAVAAAGATARRRGGKRAPLRERGSSIGSSGELSAYGRTGRGVLIAALGLGIGSAALIALWQSEGTTRETTEPLPFSEHSTFAYGAVVEAGVYDANLLAAPEPLFRQLLDDLPIEFEYALEHPGSSAELTNVLGSYEIIAEVRDDTGWKRTLSLLPTTLFAGDGFAASVRIDLGDVDRQLAEIALLTGIAQDVHALRIVARVNARGELEGLPFEREVEQFIQFRLTELQLQFDPANSQLELTGSGSVTRAVTVPRTLTLPVVSMTIPYSQLPSIAAAGIALAALGGLLVGAATLLTSRGGDAARIRATYGRLLIEFQDSERIPSASPVALNQIEDLVRIADAEGLAILHRASDLGDDYFVVARDVTWSYSSWKPRPAPPPHAADLTNVTEG